MRKVADLVPYLPNGLPVFVKIDFEDHGARIITKLLASPLAGRIMTLFYEHYHRWSNGPAIENALAGAGFGIRRRYGPTRHHDVLALPRSMEPATPILVG